MIVTEQKQAARILGVTPRTIRDWMRDYPSEVPDTSAGYDIDAWRKFRESHGKKGSPEGEQLRKLKLARQAEALKRDRVKTRHDELNLEVKEGGLLPRPTWELFGANLLSGLADWCEQLPDLIAAQCCKKCGKTIGERLKKELNKRREQLAEDLRRSPSEG
jgi:hypothetical protein